MTDHLVIKMMTSESPHWRCLHRGLLPLDGIDQRPVDDDLPWGRYYHRNRKLITKLTQRYGSCAVLALDDDKIIGHLRFYPSAVWNMKGAGYLCLQQDFPGGPGDDFADRDFPTREQLNEQTLKVHCLMTGSPAQAENPYQRQGIATTLVKTLIGWAKTNDWQRIEADSFEDLPLIYESTGNAGRTFWEKLGFKIADRFPHPQLCEYPEFAAQLKEQAKSAGVDANKACDSILMRLELAERS